MNKSRTITGFRVMYTVVVFLAILQISAGRKKFCGGDLSQVLELICPNGYNGYRMDKRNSILPEDDYNSSIDDGDGFALNMDLMKLLNRNEANSLAKTRRRRLAITHECCNNGCNVSELRAYCRR